MEVNLIIDFQASRNSIQNAIHKVFNTCAILFFHNLYGRIQMFHSYYLYRSFHVLSFFSSHLHQMLTYRKPLSNRHFLFSKGNLVASPDFLSVTFIVALSPLITALPIWHVLYHFNHFIAMIVLHMSCIPISIILIIPSLSWVAYFFAVGKIFF